MTVVDTIYVWKQDKRVGFHHLGYQSRQLVVIGKHQLGHWYGIVLVDDGQHVILEHHRHTGTLVTILLTWFKILFHGQHLTYMDMELTEQVVV